jgi:hypothetical protein
MRFRDKNGPLHHPIFKPANLPDFLTVARMSAYIAFLPGGYVPKGRKAETGESMTATT